MSLSSLTRHPYLPQYFGIFLSPVDPLILATKYSGNMLKMSPQRQLFEKRESQDRMIDVEGSFTNQFRLTKDPKDKLYKRVRRNISKRMRDTLNYYIS
jgi:hypothetical protein